MGSEMCIRDRVRFLLDLLEDEVCVGDSGLLNEGPHQPALTGEIIVDGTFGETGGPGDAVDVRADVAVTGELLRCSVEQSLPGLGLDLFFGGVRRASYRRSSQQNMGGWSPTLYYEHAALSTGDIESNASALQAGAGAITGSDGQSPLSSSASPNTTAVKA